MDDSISGSNDLGKIGDAANQDRIDYFCLPQCLADALDKLGEGQIEYAIFKERLFRHSDAKVLYLLAEELGIKQQLCGFALHKDLLAVHRPPP